MATNRNVGVNVTATNNTRAGFESVAGSAEVAGRKVASSFRASTGALGALRSNLSLVNSALLGFGLSQALDKIREFAEAAARLETIQNSLNATFGKGSSAYAQVSNTVQQYGLALEGTAGAYAKFAAATKGSVLEGAATERIFQSMAKASAALGLSADDTAGILRALGQMASKGAVQMEELKGQLGERLPGAMQMFAEANGMTVAEVYKLAEAGKLGLNTLVAFADAVDKRFAGPAQVAAGSVRAELNRLDTAWLQLKASFGDTTFAKYFVQAMTGLAEGTSLALRSMSGNLTVLEEHKKKIKELGEELIRLDEIAQGTNGAVSAEYRAKVQETKEKIDQEFFRIKALMELQEGTRPENNRGKRKFTDWKDAPVNEDEDKKRLAAAQKLADELDRLNESTMTKREKAISQVAQLNADLDKLVSAGLITQEQRYERLSERVKELLDVLNQTADQVKKSDEALKAGTKSMSDDFRRVATDMSEYAKEAARNTQDAFADFLFEPFKGGLRGMLTGFINVIRRMLAEAASARIMDALFNGSGRTSKRGGLFGSILGAVFGGLTGGTGAFDPTKIFKEADPTKIFKEAGGSVEADKPYIVGEKRPELFIPRTSGTIVPSVPGGKQVVNNYITQNITGLGMPAEQVFQVIGRNNQELIRKLSDGNRRAGLPVPRI